MGGANFYMEAKTFNELLDALENSAIENELEFTAKHGYHTSGLHFTNQITIEYKPKLKKWIAYYRYEK